MAGIYGCFKGRNSDSAAMASGPPDVTANQEPAEVVEECSGKKKSKFQTFKKFFARKKRKEASVFGVEGGLKASQSSDNVNNEPENGTLTRSEKDNGSGSKVSLGSKALSHDSIFVSDSSEAHEALGASQDSIPGKVKSLQMQLKQAIRLGSPPSLMCVKKMEDPAMSEDDGLPCSPPEYSALHTVLKQVQTNSSLSLEGTDSDEDQLSCAASSRAVSPLVVVPGDFSQPASPNVCLDNSAAKHKLGLRHKAHAKRKPASRVELRIEGDSLMDETLSTSIAESVDERDEQERGDLSGEQLRTTEEEERNEEKGEEERERLQHSIRSPLRDAEEEEGEEDELGAGADVSHAPDASSALLSDSEQRLPEEEAPDGQLPASPSTRASRLTPEPPTCQREYLPDTSLTYRRGAGEAGSERDFPLGLAEGEDDDDDGVLGNIGGMESGEEEESSFLQEVLSSLKTPLTSRSLGLEADSIVLRVDEDKQESEEEEEEGSEDALEVLEAEQDGDVEIEDEGKVNEVDREEEAVSPGSLTPPAQEQELRILDETTPSCQAFGEEEEEEDGTKEEEEKALVGQFRGQDEEEDEEEAQEAREVAPGHDTREEEDDPLTTGMNRAESDGDKEVTDPEKDSEEEEGEEEEEKKHQRQEEEEVAAWEERDGKESVEEDMGVEEDEGEEEEREEPMMEMVPDQTMVGTPTAAPVADEALDGVQEVDPAAAAEHMDQTPIHPEPCDQPFSTEPEHQATFSRSSADERADEEEGDDEGVEMEREMEKKPDMDTNQLDVEPTDSDQAGVETDQQDVDQASVGMSHLDMNTPEEDQSDPEQLAVEPAATQQAAVSSQPPSCAFPESHGYSETEPQEESETCVPSTPGNDTSIAAIVCTDSVSLSSQQAVTPDQQSTGAATAGEINDTATEQDTVKQSSSGLSVEEDTAGLGDKEAGKRSPTDAETIEETPQPSGPPTTTEEIDKQPSIGTDQSKVRFTIAPAWQRSLSTGGGSPDEPVVPPSPSSPTPCPSSVSSSSQSNPLAKAEPVSSSKVEVVLSPTSRMRNITAIPGKTQSNVTATPAKPQTSTVAATEESPVQGESPFGVRLRRTVVLHRFSSEEENTEPAVELPAQPAINKAAPPHPVSAKPSLSQPVAIKPALPRKPDVQGEKPKCTPDVTSARGAPSGSDPPSWISVARQKQRIYKDSSLDESTLRKEEPERKSSLPLYVSSAACRDHLKTPELSSKGSSLETTKPTTPVEKEGRRAFSPPTPVPPQPAKSQSHPAPIAPKPLSQPTPSPRALSAPTPVPVSQRVSPYASPPSLAKTPPSTKTPQPQTSIHPNQRPLGQSSSTLTSPPFSTRSSLAQSGTIPSRAPGLSSPTQPSQRGPLSPSSPSPSLPQVEPPWMALAKKKAKAWSEMPQIVQ